MKGKRRRATRFRRVGIVAKLSSREALKLAVALERDHQLRLAAGGVVVDIGDAVELTAVDELLDPSGDRRAAYIFRYMDAISRLFMRDCGSRIPQFCFAEHAQRGINLRQLR